MKNASPDVDAYIERAAKFAHLRLVERQLVSQFVPFGGEVLGVVFIHGRQDGNLIEHDQVKTPKIKCFGLLGVVCQQPHFLQTKILEDLNADAVVAHVGFETERMIGFYRIEAFVLQRVGEVAVPAI